jgi:hypothetical protein
MSDGWALLKNSTKERKVSFSFKDLNFQKVFIISCFLFLQEIKGNMS